MTTSALNIILDQLEHDCILDGESRVFCFSYEVGRGFEDFSGERAIDMPWPELVVMKASDPRAKLVGEGWRLEYLTNDALTREAASTRNKSCSAAPVLRSSFSKHDYLRAVSRALEYIRAGDIYQVNLAQRLEVKNTRSPAEVFERLCAISPAAYGAMIDLGEVQLLCNSPEVFLDITVDAKGTRRIINRPIKGTRPNLPGMYEELLTSEKDRAELAMIVDLQRNDLGRVCETGSVKVTSARELETQGKVIHGVASVEGVLLKGMSLSEIMRASFPCGSITGCPKIRAMQIVEELEPVARGPYCGTIGVVRPDGSMTLNVAIRSMLLHAGTAYVYVGGGIVADSDAESEYQETLVKARAMLEALGE